MWILLEGTNVNDKHFVVGRPAWVFEHVWEKEEKQIVWFTFDFLLGLYRVPIGLVPFLLYPNPFLLSGYSVWCDIFLASRPPVMTVVLQNLMTAQVACVSYNEP